MRIGVTTFGSDGGRSGIGRYLIHLLREFSERRNGNRFEMVGFEDEKGTFLPEGADMEYHAVSDRLRHPVVNLAWHQLGLRTWARRRELDVLFLPAANRRVPIGVSCPTVGTVHDFSSLHVEGKYDPLRMVYIKKVLPALVRRLTRVITPSECSKKDIVEYAGVPADRVHVIPHGVDRDLYHPGDPEAARRTMAERHGVDGPYIAYTSRLEHPGKNHVPLIRAFERVKRALDVPHRLVLAGSDWSGAEAIHQAAEASPFAADIRFLGFVPSTDLPDLYRGADVFVFPSLYEGFGMPVLEAMACGVPVACSDVSSIPEVVGDAAVLFQPTDPASIASALEGLLGDDGRRADVAERGRARADGFHWSTAAAESIRVLETAAKEGER